MKLTLAIAAYKIESFVEECLESVRAQSNQDFALMAVDDGSPDKTGAILDSFAATYPKLRVVHQQNAGISCVRNTMIALCETEYLWMIDGDDTIPPDAVAKLLPCLDGRREAVYFSYTKYASDDGAAWTNSVVDLNDKQLQGLRYKCMLRDSEPLIQKINANSSVMSAHKVSMLRENGIEFEPGRKSSQDVLFTASFLRYAKYVAYLDSSLYFYRVNEGSVSLRYSAGFTDRNIEWFDVIKKVVDAYYPDDKHMYELMYGRYLGTASSSILLEICHPHNPNGYFTRRAQFLHLTQVPQIRLAIAECPDSLLARNTKIFKALMKRRCFFPANLFAHVIMRKRYAVFSAHGGKVVK